MARWRLARRWTARSCGTCSARSSMLVGFSVKTKRSARRWLRHRPGSRRIGLGQDGQLQEWLEDWDMTAPERQHRHVSHLYAVYPSAQLASGTTPALTAAARRSLDLRGDESTGLGDGVACSPCGPGCGDPERAYDIDRVPAVAGALVPEPVRRASAVPDRRQLRGHGRHRRDAAAVARGRHRPAAGAAEGVGRRVGHRACVPEAASRSISSGRTARCASRRFDRRGARRSRFGRARPNAPSR